MDLIDAGCPETVSQNAKFRISEVYVGDRSAIDTVHAIGAVCVICAAHFWW